MSQNHKIGAPPGSILYTGEVRNEKINISLIQFTEETIEEESFQSIPDLLKAIKPDFIKWINIEGLHHVEEIETLGKHYNIHPLTLEDVVNVNQRPKFEDYDHYTATFMKMLYLEDGIKSEHLSVMLFNDTVITFQEPHGGDAFDIIRKRLRLAKGRVRRMGADYLAYTLIDAVVDCYFKIMESVSDKIEDLEDAIMNNPQSQTLMQIHKLKREMIYLRKQVWPIRELVNNMSRSETALIKDSTDVYLRDLQDHVTRIIDSVETFRDLLSGMLDIYLSTNSNKMNEVMKALTIISSIFIPVTFIAGVYGMNFHNMPELYTEYGYFAVVFVMITIMVSMYMYFKHKKWF